MKKFLLLTLSLFIAVCAVAQTETAEEKKPSNWKVSGILSLNASATGLVNWAAGGNNNINTVAAANVTLLYKNENVAWESNLDTDYGMTYVSDNNFPWRKSNDKLNFSTKFGWEYHKTWYLTVAGVFKTQYSKGFDYKNDEKIYTSNIMSPSYTDLSVGIDWKPNEIFSVYLAPVTGRITTALDNELHKNYIADIVETQNYKAELGISLKGTVNYTLVKNLKILSTLTLFTPYNKSFGNIDVDWDFAISYQFLKVLNVSLGTQLKYYDSVLIADKEGNMAPRVQFKSVFGLGVGYSF